MFLLCNEKTPLCRITIILPLESLLGPYRFYFMKLGHGPRFEETGGPQVGDLGWASWGAFFVPAEVKNMGAPSCT